MLVDLTVVQVHQGPPRSTSPHPAWLPEGGYVPGCRPTPGPRDTSTPPSRRPGPSAGRVSRPVRGR